MGKEFEFAYGYSRTLRLRDPRFVMARSSVDARRLLRERLNLRTTRGMSIVPRVLHDEEVMRYRKVQGT